MVRNAGDGTLSVYFNAGKESGPLITLPPPFLPPVTLSVGPGVSDAALANVSFPTESPAIAVLVADLEGNGILDKIILSAGGVTVYRGDGQGGLLPDPFTIAAGPDPTGMTVADLRPTASPTCSSATPTAIS